MTDYLDQFRNSDSKLEREAYSEVGFGLDRLQRQVTTLERYAAMHFYERHLKDQDTGLPIGARRELVKDFIETGEIPSSTPNQSS